MHEANVKWKILDRFGDLCTKLDLISPLTIRLLLERSAVLLIYWPRFSVPNVLLVLFSNQISVEVELSFSHNEADSVESSTCKLTKHNVSQCFSVTTVKLVNYEIILPN